MAPRRGRKGKQGGKQGKNARGGGGSSGGATGNNNAGKSGKLTLEEQQKRSNESNELILTSDRRRGVFECDYCHSDISQTPRIRCAVCDDFDLCCDCFATTDHVTLAKRFRAAEAVNEQIQGSQFMMSSLSKEHDPLTHGYRVCDSCRYPVFPIKSSIKSALSSKKKREKAAEGKKETMSTLSADDDEMDIDDENETDEAVVDDDTAKESQKDNNNNEVIIMQAGDDPKNIWTVEEDLRLLRGIETHGLGNWTDIAEAVAGPGSFGKTAKRCMERYFDDYLGRFGHILPAYTLIAENTGDGDDNDKKGSTDGTLTPNAKGSDSISDKINDTASIGSLEAATRTSKRRSTMLRSPSSMSGNITAPAKKYKAVLTESLPEFQNLWPEPYLPTFESGQTVTMGQEVGRDQATRAEQAYVRSIASMDSIDQVNRIRDEWAKNRLNKPGGPTVLPMRADDVPTLPGSELVGYMPRRGDFDVEWENGAEEAIADMEFIPGESEEDRQIKLKVLEIYNGKLDEREKRKKFILSRRLYDYRKRQQEYERLPQDERDLVNRMRLFERFHTPEEHKQFIEDLLKAKRLRKEIAKLQMYRRMGIRTLAEAEQYEIDKRRRQFHKTASLQKESGKRAEANTAAAIFDPKAVASDEGPESSSFYWKQYKTTDRRVRKSLNRDTVSPGDANTITAENASGESDKKMAGSATTGDDKTEQEKNDSKKKESTGKPSDANDIDPKKEEGKDVANEMGESGTKAATSDESNKPIEKEEKPRIDLSTLPKYDLLSRQEVELCTSNELTPAQYLEIKKALICESLVGGLLDDNNNTNTNTRQSTKNNSISKLGKKIGNSIQQTLVKIDIERRGAVIDFVVRAGWIPTQFGQALREATG